MRTRIVRAHAPILAALLLIALPPAQAEDAPDAEARLSGRDIYQRVLDNRFSSYVQLSDLRSGDRGGHDQASRFRMWFESYREKPAESRPGGALSKTLVKYLAPFDIRHSGYLVIHKLHQANDQFVYLSSRRRVQRINLRGEALFGTDFSFEDVVPREIEDASYRRLPDAAVDGVPCFAVEARPVPTTDSAYSRFEMRVEKARSVPLLTRYWSEVGVAVKELRVDSAAIERIEGVWVPMHLTMVNLREDSFTELTIREIQPNAKLRKTTFDLRRLESH